MRVHLSDVQLVDAVHLSDVQLVDVFHLKVRYGEEGTAEGKDGGESGEYPGQVRVVG